MGHRGYVMTTKKLRTILAGNLLISTATLFGAPAYAQDDSAPEIKPERLDEIIVTARRREESVQDTPVTVTGLSQEYLENTGARTFEDFANTVPGLSFVGNGSPENKIVLRGVSTGVASRDEGAVIGLYIDDVPISSRRFNPDLRLYDLERIEVLRGPQGTLFGEGSIGGTIRLVPNKPNLTEVESNLQTTISGTQKGGVNYEVAGVLNAPIVEDKFGVRLVAYKVEESGYVENATLNDDNVGATDTYGGRIIASFNPNDAVSLTASVLYQDSEARGKPQFDPGLGDLNQARNFPEELADEFTLANLTANIDLGSVTLDLSSAYFDRSVINLRDISPLLGGLPIFLDDLTTFESFVQEFRFTSNEGLFNDRLDWVVGGFYRSDEEFFTQDSQAAALGGDVLDSNNTLNREQISFFGEADLKVTDKLTATAGLRWFNITQDGVSENAGLLAGLAPGVIDVVTTNASESGFSPKFRLAYEANDDLLVYGIASRGFREGGATGQGVPPDPISGDRAPNQFESDALWNYELGFKSSLNENRITLNGALYYIDWQNIQSNFIRSDGFTFTVNAGSARSMGAELELRALVSPGLELFSTASYVNSELTEDQLPPGDGVSGDRIPGVPDLTLTAGIDYSRPLLENIDGFLNFNVKHVGDSFNGFTSSTGVSAAAVDRQPSYELANLRLGLKNEDWELAFFVKNLTDERAVLFFNRIVGDVRINTTRPRTIGLFYKAKF